MTKILAKLLEKRRTRVHSLFRRGSGSSKSKKKKKYTSEEECSDTSSTLRLEDSISEQSTSVIDPVAQISLDGSIVSLANGATSCELLVPSDAIPQDCFQATTVAEDSELGKNRKRVTFHNVSVRHYELIIGSNANKANFPLGLGWNYQSSDTVEVEEYEGARKRRLEQKIQDCIRPRLYVATDEVGAVDHYQSDVHIDQDYDEDVNEIVLLDTQQRRTRLRNYGYTEAELRCAERHRKVTLALECSKYNPEEESSVPSQPPYFYSPKFMTRYCF